METIILTPFLAAIIAYLVLINIIAFIIYGLDKAKAGQAGARRISERTLLVIALIGGSLGALAGMNVFRHKTKKMSFQAVLAMILALQILAIWYFLGRPEIT